MKTRDKLLIAALAFGLALTASAQDKGKPAAKPAPAPAVKAQPAPDAKMKAAMEAVQKAAQPGEPHKKLAEMAGKWDVTVKAWMGPGEPQVSTGTSEIAVVLGGRFIEEHFKGTFDGQPFDGMGLTGYDNVTKKYTAVWIDSMGTGVMTGSGQMDASGKVFNGTNSYNDPVSGKPKTMREVTRHPDKDTRVTEMYEKGPDGKEMKTMEMTYKRAK